MGIWLSSFPFVRRHLPLYHIGICAILWFPFDPVGGFLASMSALIIGWFRCFFRAIATSFVCYKCTLELLLHLTSSEFFQIIGLFVTLAWVDVGCLNAFLPMGISHRLQFIPLEEGIQYFFSTLGFAVISGKLLHYQQWEYINVSLLVDHFMCLTSTHLFELVRLY